MNDKDEETMNGIRKFEEEIDDVFLDDVFFAIPRDPNQPKVKVRALSDYCKLKNVVPSDLSFEEIKRFLVRKKGGIKKGLKSPKIPAKALLETLGDV